MTTQKHQTYCTEHPADQEWCGTIPETPTGGIATWISDSPDGPTVSLDVPAKTITLTGTHLGQLIDHLQAVRARMG